MKKADLWDKDKVEEGINRPEMSDFFKVQHDEIDTEYLYVLKPNMSCLEPLKIN